MSGSPKRTGVISITRNKKAEEDQMVAASSEDEGEIGTGRVGTESPSALAPNHTASLTSTQLMSSLPGASVTPSQQLLFIEAQTNLQREVNEGLRLSSQAPSAPSGGSHSPAGQRQKDAPSLLKGSDVSVSLRFLNKATKTKQVPAVANFGQANRQLGRAPSLKITSIVEGLKYAHVENGDPAHSNPLVAGMVLSYLMLILSHPGDSDAEVYNRKVGWYLIRRVIAASKAASGSQNEEFDSVVRTQRRLLLAAILVGEGTSDDDLLEEIEAESCGAPSEALPPHACLRPAKME